MEISVTKHIRTFKDLPIIWKENRDCFQLSLRAIGGKQPTFKSKSEAVAFAKDAFTDWRDGVTHSHRVGLVGGLCLPEVH